VKPRFGLDLYYQNYRSFFLDRVDRGDNTPFRDSLFKTGDGLTRFPDMHLRSYGINLFYIFLPANFSLSGAMTSRNLIHKSGVSPVVMTSARSTAFSNSGSIIPEKDKIYYGDDAGLEGGTINTFSLLPGLGGSFVWDALSFNAIVFWGQAYQTQNLSGIAADKTTFFASSGDIRGSILYNSAGYFGGISGYKSVVSNTLNSFGISQANSSVELFFGHHF
jgi:hypothetical protein